MKIQRIQPPKYFIGDEEYNELEIRQMQIDVKNGLLPMLRFTDELGEEIFIFLDGRLSKHPHRFGCAYELVKQLLD